jgi:hypothetical protein
MGIPFLAIESCMAEDVVEGSPNSTPKRSQVNQDLHPENNTFYPKGGDVEGKYLNPITPSGSCFEFPSHVTIEPKECRRFKVCARVESNGRQTMALLMSYCKVGGTTADFRNSFASFEFYVFSSLVVSARIAPRQPKPVTISPENLTGENNERSHDTLERLLLVDLKSYLEADDDPSSLVESIKGSSRETLYLGENSTLDLLDEGSIRIESLLVAGSLLTHPMPAATAADMYKTIRTHEKASLFFPSAVSVTESARGANVINPQVF